MVGWVAPRPFCFRELVMSSRSSPATGQPTHTSSTELLLNLYKPNHLFHDCKDYFLYLVELLFSFQFDEMFWLQWEWKTNQFHEMKRQHGRRPPTQLVAELSGFAAHNPSLHQHFIFLHSHSRRIKFVDSAQLVARLNKN